MEESDIFFGRPQSTTILRKFQGKLDAIHTNDDFELARNAHIRTIIHSMAEKPEQWDELCTINIGWIGSSFFGRLSDDAENLDKDKMDDIFSMCFRFLFELYLSIKNDLAREFEVARQFAFSQINQFEPNSREQIEYAIRDMPINILKSLANSDAIESLKNFNSISMSAEKKQKKWEEDLTNRENRVNTLKNALSKYEAGFNFVGLHDGFNELLEEKLQERTNYVRWLRIVGFLVVAPLIGEVIFYLYNLESIDKFANEIALSIIPVVSLVAILIYFFRVILQNYKAVKSQIIQIELRKTLCRFIQHYAEYSEEIKEKDKVSLEKFENIIFSGIVADDSKLPATFDGVEQLGQLIKSVK